MEGADCAHIQQVLEVQPNLDVSLVLGRLLGVEACVLLDLGHGFVQRLGVHLDDQERDQQTGREHAHHRVERRGALNVMGVLSDNSRSWQILPTAFTVAKVTDWRRYLLQDTN